ncbi:MAG: porin family protein [Prevotella sp.]|nr:porin family protein [Prevotella sp.]
MSEQWIQQMQQKMADYKRPAPEVSWDEIDQALAAGKARKTRQLWLRRMAAAAVILLIAGAGYWGFKHTETGQNPPTVATMEENQGGKSYDSNTNQNPAPMLYTSAPMALAKSAKASSISDMPVHESGTVNPVSTEESDTLDAAVTEDVALPRSNQGNSIRPKGQTSPIPAAYPTTTHQQKHIDNRLMAKVYMSSSTGNSFQTETNNLYRIGANTAFAYYGELSSANHIEQHVHHRQPIRVGLSLRYRLDDRWGVESGLLYTHLSSDITTTVDGATTITEQRLNYIGLPLNISYELWKNRNFGLYVSAGGTIEKQLEASPWQFSLNGAAGAEYKLTDIFSLYAEPGLGYYFKDGSSTPTIYQDRPLNFNLSFGLRFNIK